MLTFRYLSYAALLTKNVPKASISITVLNALYDILDNGQRKLPAASTITRKEKGTAEAVLVLGNRYGKVRLV